MTMDKRIVIKSWYFAINNSWITVMIDIQVSMKVGIITLLFYKEDAQTDTPEHISMKL